MAKRVVAADASPLIGLAAAGAFDLLRGLFGRVTVTAAVRDEVRAGGDRPGAKELADAIAEGWIEVAPTPSGLDAFPELSAGEASTLLLAQGMGEEALVLMDERLGRARARSLGLPIAGLAGVLLAAKRDGLVGNLRPLLERIERNNFRLSGELVQALLGEAGEG
jgi:hypothetical protein